MAFPVTDVEQLERVLLQRGVGELEAGRNSCADCGRTYFSSAPNLVERGKRCPRCNGVLRRRAGNDRWAPPSKT